MTQSTGMFRARPCRAVVDRAGAAPSRVGQGTEELHLNCLMASSCLYCARQGRLTCLWTATVHATLQIDLDWWVRPCLVGATLTSGCDLDWWMRP